jgi:hypothetical protein
MKSLISMSLLVLVQGAAIAQGVPPTPTQAPPPMVQRMLDLEQRHQTTISGANARPGQALAMFFTMHAPADDNAFAQFALERYGAAGADTETLKQARGLAQPAVTDLCMRILDGSLPDGMSIAKYIVKANDDYDQQIAASYHAAVIDKLSPRVRANVLRKIDEDSAGIAGSEFDHIAAAQDDPELYKMLVRGRCSGAKHMRELQRQQPKDDRPPNGISADKQP